MIEESVQQVGRMIGWKIIDGIRLRCRSAKDKHKQWRGFQDCFGINVLFGHHVMSNTQNSGKSPGLFYRKVALPLFVI